MVEINAGNPNDCARILPTYGELLHNGFVLELVEASSAPRVELLRWDERIIKLPRTFRKLGPFIPPATSIRAFFRPRRCRAGLRTMAILGSSCRRSPIIFDAWVFREKRCSSRALRLLLGSPISVSVP